MRVLPVFLLIALLLPAAPARADFAAGMAAYEAGDYAATYQAWRPLAEQGDSRAQYGMGRLYRYGRGVDQNYETAVAWYTKAARQTEDGDSMRRAVYALGYMAAHGHGMAKDMAKAECLYRVSAMNGYANGQWALSRVLRAKPGIDFTVFDWVERAAAQGEVLSMQRLGFIDYMNPYVERADAYKWTILAAERGNKDAFRELAQIRQSAQENPNVQKALLEAERKAKAWRAVPEDPPAKPFGVPKECWP